MYNGDFMNTNIYTTITVDRETLNELKRTNNNRRSANALIQDLIALHNDLKTDMGF